MNPTDRPLTPDPVPDPGPATDNGHAGGDGAAGGEGDGNGARRGETHDERRRKGKSAADFLRACRYLYPYRRTVVASVLCAMFVGLAFTGGLGTMLPIMRVLVEGDTLKGWVDREIAERRLGVKFAEHAAGAPAAVQAASPDLGKPFEDPAGLRLVTAKRGKPAAAAGLGPADAVVSVDGAATPAAMLAALADPAVRSAGATTAAGRRVTLALPGVPWYLSAARNLAARLPTQPVKAIAAVFALIATLAVVSNVVKFFQEYLSDKAAILAVNDVRRRLYDHVLHVPMSHFGTRGTSDVTSRLVSDSQQMEQGFKTVLGQSIQEPIKAAMAFGLAVYVSWQLTLFIVVFAPLMLVVIKKLGKKMRRASRAALQNSASMLGQIEATLAGIRVVKGATAERFERRRYSRIMRSLVDEQLRMSRIDAFSGPTMETLTLFVVGAVVLFAAHLVLVKGTLETTSFFLVMACLAAIGDSLRRVSKVNNVLQKANAAAGRVFEVMDLPVERNRGAAREALGHGRTTERGREPAAAGLGAPAAPAPGVAPLVKLPPLRREVRFEDITFSYPRSSGPALVGVSLAVPKGLSVAVVGRNGSGKTTLLALLPRFYDPDAGRVLIDGVDVRHATLRSLRGQISIVTQDSVIFPGTIAENIAYGRPLAGRDEVEAAAKRAFAHDFILEKPLGYETVLGELGGQLSGGQKQRLCIARAILRKAPILILDEATSQVDAESEHLIQQALDALIHERTADAQAAGQGAGPTTFIIAHRLGTIQGADTIVVMDRGRIVGQGRHEELLATCETYQLLYERQLFAAPVAPA